MAASLSGLILPASYLINTARGVIADEQAVCEGLKLGKIAGMGTDVFVSEPVLADHPLLAFDVFEGREPVNKLA